MLPMRLARIAPHRHHGPLPDRMVSAMAVPEVIPIAYEPKHRTESIGRYADGQFLAGQVRQVRAAHAREGYRMTRRAAPRRAKLS